MRCKFLLTCEKIIIDWENTDEETKKLPKEKREFKERICRAVSSDILLMLEQYRLEQAKLEQAKFLPMIIHEAEELQACAAEGDPGKLAHALSFPTMVLKSVLKSVFKNPNANEDKKVFDKALNYLKLK